MESHRWESVFQVLQTLTVHHRQMDVCVPCPPNTYGPSQTDGCLCPMSSKHLQSISHRWVSVSRVLQMLPVHHRQMGVCVTCPPKAKDHHRQMGVCVSCPPNGYGPSQTDGRLCPMSSKRLLSIIDRWVSVSRVLLMLKFITDRWTSVSHVLKLKVNHRRGREKSKS